MADKTTLTEEQRTILISKIEKYMPKFVAFFQKGYIKLTDSESKEIASLMREINPRFNFNYKLNCNSCIRDAVTSLSNYYSRERSKVEFPISPEQTEKQGNGEMETIQLLSTIESEESEVIKDEAYYQSLDKRSKEYKAWKSSQEQ